MYWIKKRIFNFCIVQLLLVQAFLAQSIYCDIKNDQISLKYPKVFGNFTRIRNMYTNMFLFVFSLLVTQTYGCTNYLITPGASREGTLISYAADSGAM